jgi:small nuclear ribonucleoprotein (snRNP)-like protein
MGLLAEWMSRGQWANFLLKGAHGNVTGAACGRVVTADRHGNVVLDSVDEVRVRYYSDDPGRAATTRHEERVPRAGQVFFRGEAILACHSARPGARARLPYGGMASASSAKKASSSSSSSSSSAHSTDTRKSRSRGGGRG